MFFLEAFLAHYRRLGADRFIVLDDRSTDGTMAFLAAQPDVMVVGSGIRYFAEVPYPPETLARIRETRAVRLWRDQMLDQFCTGQWAVVVDPDEFLALPADLPAFFASLAAEGAEAAWGVDGRHVPGTGARHPRRRTPRASASRTPGSSTRGRTSTRGQPRETPPVPRTVYPGSVARLFATWGVLPQGTLVAADPPPALRLPLPGREPDPQDPGRLLAPGRLVPELPRDEQAGRPPGRPDHALQVHRRPRAQDRVRARAPAATTRARAATGSTPR